MTKERSPVAATGRLLWRVRAAVPVSDLGAADAGAASIVVRPGDTTTIRLRRRYTLVAVLSGSVAVTIEGRIRQVNAGEIALLTPGGREVWRFSETEDTQYSWLTLGAPRLPATQLAQLDAAPFALPISPAMAGLFTAARVSSEGPAAAHGALVWLVAAALALYIGEAQTQGLLGASGSLPAAVTAAQAVVRVQLDQRIRLSDLAAAGSVVPAHLVRLFRRHLGTTPVRYL